MNKAFVREPDVKDDFCPRCGSRGEPVEGDTLRAYLSEAQRRLVTEPASFCPSPGCPVVYFDCFERSILASRIQRPVYPKDPAAPICACLGLTREDIEKDVKEGVTTRTRAAVEEARSPAARCRRLAANGRPCTAYVQKYYMQRINAGK